jgi:anti-anti-sigma factor
VPDLAVSIFYDPELVLSLSGELDVATAPRLRGVIDALFEEPDVTPQCLALDLHAVRFMDSTGVAVLARALKLSRASGCRFYLRNVSSRCAVVLRATGLTSTIECEPAIDASLGT